MPRANRVGEVESERIFGGTIMNHRNLRYDLVGSVF
jgi:hypothetical protein